MKASLMTNTSVHKEYKRHHCSEHRTTFCKTQQTCYITTY